MGFLRSLIDLHRIGREQQRRMDVGGSMANAQAQLDQLNRSFEVLGTPPGAAPAAPPTAPSPSPAAPSSPTPTRAPHQL